MGLRGGIGKGTWGHQERFGEGGEVNVGLKGGTCVPCVSPQMPPEPGWPQHQHPDLHLDQVHLRPWQEIHCHGLRDLALRLPPSRLGGTGRPQPHCSGALGCPSLQPPCVGQDLSPRARGGAPGPTWGRTEVAVALVEAARGGRQQPQYLPVMHRPVVAGEQGAERDLQWKEAPPSGINTDPGRRCGHLLGVGDPALAALPYRMCRGHQQLCQPPHAPAPWTGWALGPLGAARCSPNRLSPGATPSSPSPALILPHQCVYKCVCKRIRSAGCSLPSETPRRPPPYCPGSPIPWQSNAWTILLEIKSAGGNVCREISLISPSHAGAHVRKVPALLGTPGDSERLRAPPGPWQEPLPHLSPRLLGGTSLLPRVWATRGARTFGRASPCQPGLVPPPVPLTLQSAPQNLSPPSFLQP